MAALETLLAKWKSVQIVLSFFRFMLRQWDARRAAKNVRMRAQKRTPYVRPAETPALNAASEASKGIGAPEAVPLLL